MQKELLGKSIKTEEGERVESLIANKVIFTADGSIINMPEKMRRTVNYVPENVTREYVINKIEVYAQSAEQLIEAYRNGDRFIPWKSDRSIMSIGNIIAALAPGLASLAKRTMQ